MEAPIKFTICHGNDCFPAHNLAPHVRIGIVFTCVVMAVLADGSMECKLTAIEQEQDTFAAIDLEEQVKEYVADLQTEMDELINATPQTPEDHHQVFLLKKRIVDTVLAEARIDENRDIHVKFRRDLLNFVGHEDLQVQTEGIDKPFHASPTVTAL